MITTTDKRQQLLLKKLKKNYKVISMQDICEDCHPHQKTNPANVCVGQVVDAGVINILSQFDNVLNIQYV
jgi:hypothetical protein